MHKVALMSVTWLHQPGFLAALCHLWSYY